MGAPDGIDPDCGDNSDAIASRLPTGGRLDNSRRPCRVPAASNGICTDARLPNPHLRSPAPERCGAADAAVRVGAPQARSWAAAFYRFARSLRRDAVRDRYLVAALPGGGRAAAGERGDDDGADRRPLG